VVCAAGDAGTRPSVEGVRALVTLTAGCEVKRPGPAVTREIMEEMRPLYRDRGLQSLSSSTGVPEFHDGDTMRLHRILGLALLAAALPAIASAQKTTYDFDKSAPFGSFRTYSTKVGTPTKNELVDKRIMAAIEAQLAAKGFTRNDAAPDVVVLFHMAFDEQKDISTFSSGPMYGGYGYG
jgi:hypothetical protein